MPDVCRGHHLNVHDTAWKMNESALVRHQHSTSLCQQVRLRAAEKAMIDRRQIDDWIWRTIQHIEIWGAIQGTPRSASMRLRGEQNTRQ